MLEVNAIVAKYGNATALWDVSLAIAPGELVCVVGPNGAGKSTLINAVAGIHRIAGGRLSLDGDDVSRLPPHRFCGRGIAIGHRRCIRAGLEPPHEQLRTGRSRNQSGCPSRRLITW